MKTITLTAPNNDGITFAAEARLTFPPDYSVSRRRYLNGRQVTLMSGPYIQAQTWTLTALMSEPMLLKLMGWANAKTLLTLVDGIDNNQATVRVIPEFEPTNDRFWSVLPLVGSSDTGWVEGYSVPLAVETVTQYRGSSSGIPLLDVGDV